MGRWKKGFLHEKRILETLEGPSVTKGRWEWGGEGLPDCGITDFFSMVRNPGQRLVTTNLGLPGMLPGEKEEGRKEVF